MKPRGAAGVRRPGRRRVLLAAWLLGGGAVLARSVQVQVVDGEVWREAALQQHRTSQEVPAPRGVVLDRDGAVLAESRESYRVGVAPRELEDRDAAVEILAEALDVRRERALRLTDPRRRWAMAPGNYPPAVREALSGVRGVYLERVLERFHPHGDLARGVLGVVAEGRGRGGVEQAFDSVLRGRPGREVLARNAEGEVIPGEVFRVEPPVPGGSVTLTLDLELQEIAEEALADAVERTGARGGDLLVTDPATGEVLAMVSVKDGRTDALSAVNAPYEPGSTLKPFTVAALLADGAASLGDSVDTGEGSWWVAGRTLTDTRAHGVLTLADALRLSSNVGIAKAAEALSPGRQYEVLRDFGFGVQTGLAIPGEVAGTLRRPHRWSAQSPASLAIGYEIGVTPIQMAMAYGALANGGVLMEPILVREARSSDGRVERVEPREVRRVVPREVTRKVASVLVDVVEDGTGTAARLGTFRVAGKSGTSRAWGAGGYRSGEYFSSFAGFFPADDPQLVIFVKLHAPRGVYYGGATAAPVTRATMEAALAARRTPLDRRALIRSARPGSASRTPVPPPPVRFADVGDGAPGGARRDGTPPWLREPAPEARRDPFARGVPLPDVRGLPPRVAVRRLHALGLRVSWSGTGAVAGSAPPDGARVQPGDTIRVWGREGER